MNTSGLRTKLLMDLFQRCTHLHFRFYRGLHLDTAHPFTEQDPDAALPALCCALVGFIVPFGSSHGTGCPYTSATISSVSISAAIYFVQINVKVQLEQPTALKSNRLFNWNVWRVRWREVVVQVKAVWHKDTWETTTYSISYHVKGFMCDDCPRTSQGRYLHLTHVQDDPRLMVNVIGN